MVFWLGDLNYRFDELDVDQVKALIDKQNFDKLYSYDQVFHYIFFILGGSLTLNPISRT